jgi:hypothetical protein
VSRVTVERNYIGTLETSEYITSILHGIEKIIEKPSGTPVKIGFRAN